MQTGVVASEFLADRAEFKYFPPEDFARLDYGRLLWKNPTQRARLMKHWTDARHPYADRFSCRRLLVDNLLSCPIEELDEVAKRHGESLRTAIREIPPVFGSFWSESR